MKTIRLGKTELMVTEVGFGGIPIIPLPKDKAVSVVRHCFELGINFFDTANSYRDSEEKIGVALNGVRDKVILATKTMERNGAEASAHIDLSLKQLKSDWIDVYQIHNVSNEDNLEKVLAPGGAYEAAEKARTEGKIRFIGITSHSISTATKALNTGLFQTLMFPFNFIESDPAEALFPLARKKDMGLIGMKPLGGGLLERAHLCFGFLQKSPDVVPIPGIQSKEEVEEIKDLYENPRPLSEADYKEMEAIREALGDKFCHRCEYCMPCEQGVKIPFVLIYKGFVKRFSTKIANSLMEEAMKSAEECLECRQCEDKCPYDLPVTDLIKENLALYKSSL
jgi:predicted aldo/keto reductase-like oxidoreductase